MAVLLCGSLIETDRGDRILVALNWFKPGLVQRSIPFVPAAILRKVALTNMETETSNTKPAKATAPQPAWQHEGSLPTQPIIEFSHVGKRYRGRAALADLSLTVAAGTFFALLGPNGAGKTTCIRMMSTLTRPTTGTIRVGGHDVVKDAAGVRRQIGVVFQNHSLDDDLTVNENLHLHSMIHSMQAADSRRRTNALLDLVGMAARTRQLVRSLSGGEKRRVEIVRALLHRPRILYLDEPTVGLDTQVRNALWSYLKHISAAEGVTVVFTTHYLEEAEANADEVALINRGQLLGSGTTEALNSALGTTRLTDAYLQMTGKEPN